MKQYVNSIKKLILDQIVPGSGKICIVKIEGINSPVVYSKICSELCNTHNLIVIPKISLQRYFEFKGKNNPAWGQALRLLEVGDNPESWELEQCKNELSYIDWGDSITNWRNTIVDRSYQDKTVLLLLMGTESIVDKGGLEDFYRISDDVIVENFSEEGYGDWFRDIFLGNLLPRDEIQAINQLYRAIFCNTHRDLLTLSNYVDFITGMFYSTTQELLDHILATLNEFWSLPPILDSKRHVTPQKLIKSKIKAASIIDEAYKFIYGSKSILTDSAEGKVKSQLNQYATDTGLDISMPFPVENSVYSSYSEFSQAVVDYLNCKDIATHRIEFLKIDFSILHDILKIKRPTTTKKTRAIVPGEPLEVYIDMFHDIIDDIWYEYKKVPESLTVKVCAVKLSNVSDYNENINSEDILEENYSNICAFMGGMLDYLNKAAVETSSGERISIEYYSEKDPFDMRNFAEYRHIIKLSSKWGDPCQIDFDVYAKINNTNLMYEFRWRFSPYSAWLGAFSFINRSFRNSVTTIERPIMLYCRNMNKFLSCESEEQFFAEVDKILVDNLEDDVIGHINTYFQTRHELINKFQSLLYVFRCWMESLSDTGLFNSLQEINNVIDKYISLLKYVNENIEDFTGIQRSKLFLFLNNFLITSKLEAIETGSFGEVIIPAYHPVMLEKTAAKFAFLRNGFKEIVESLLNPVGIKQKNRIENLFQLAAITQGPDIIFTNTDTFLTSQSSWKYYSVYQAATTSPALVANSSDDSMFVSDDDTENIYYQLTPDSNVIIRNIFDYIRTFPARIDGLNIAFIAPANMQYIVAAIHKVSDALEKAGVSGKINTTIVCTNTQKNSASYIRHWLDKYFSNEHSIKINTCLRYITGNDIEELNYLLENIDLCFINNVLTPNKVDFINISSDDTESDINIAKFPMVYIPDLISANPSKTTRQINISHFQFLAAMQYTQLARALGLPSYKRGVYRAINSLYFHEHKQAIIKIALQKCRWTVCIDSSVDRKLLEDQGHKVIGFSTGEGRYGELNVTVSASEQILADIKSILKRRMSYQFPSWSADLIKAASDYCVDLCKELDGSKILKALNPYNYEVHSFLAYVLALQIHEITSYNAGYITRNLISLDSYQHWFEGGYDDTFDNTNSRPDFLLLEVPLTSDNLDLKKPLSINATVIECKMGNKSPDYLAKAQEQLRKGLLTLISAWKTGSESVAKRYWYNQLYRAAVFSPLFIESNNQNYQIIAEKFLGITIGKFTINWAGEVLAFWLDDDSDSLGTKIVDSYLEDSTVETFKIYTAGQLYIQRMLQPESNRSKEYEFDVVDPTLEEESESINNDSPQETSSSNIPSVSSLHRPFLQFLSDRNVHTRQESLAWMRRTFALTSKDLEMRYSNGNIVYETTLDAVISDFRASKILENSSLANFMITKHGKKVWDIYLLHPEVFTIKEALKIVSAEQINNETVTVESSTSESEEGIQIYTDSTGIIKNEPKKIDVRSVRLLLGTDMRTKEKFFWEFGNKELSNRHLLINGNSGCGKTYCIQALLMELALQGCSAIVFDYTGGFTKSKLEKAFVTALREKLQQRVIRQNKIPINPFLKSEIQIDENEYIPEDDVDVATKIANIFESVYKFGGQQKSAIYTAALTGLKVHGESMTFEILAQELENIDNSYAKTVLSKIRPFIDLRPFIKGEVFSWGDIRNAGGVVYVIQLQGYDRNTQILLTEMLLWDIWSFCVKDGDESKPLTLVLDEAQNLSHSIDSPSAKILTEGRKFGISGWYATQFMKPQMSDDEIQRLQQASQKLYFCPPDEGVTTVAKNIDITAQGSKDWAERLKKLKKGECVTCGGMMRNDKWWKYEPCVIKVNSLEERIKHD